MQHWISGGLKLGGLSVVVLVAASAVASVIALVAGWSRMAGIQEILGAPRARIRRLSWGLSCCLRPRSWRGLPPGGRVRVS